MNTRRSSARLLSVHDDEDEDYSPLNMAGWTARAREGRRAKSTASAAKRRHGAVNSLSVFRSFMGRDEQGRVTGVEGLFSRKCLEAWLSHRTRETLSPRDETYQESFIRFRRSLMAHISGSDGRVPFEPEEEATILAYIRQKDVWTEFTDVLSCSRNYKCRTKGFHETKAEGRTSGKTPIKRKRKSYAETTASDSSSEEDYTLTACSTSTSPATSAKRVHVDLNGESEKHCFFPLPTPTAFNSPSHPIVLNHSLFDLDDVELSIVEELCF